MKREMFGYVPGGYQRILQTMATRLQAMGVQILTGRPVTQVDYDSETAQLRITSGRQPQISSHDRVIMTVPSPQISRSCTALTDGEHQRLGSADYLGVICTSLLLDRPLAGYYVTNITDRSVPLTGIIEMGAIVQPQYLGGQYLVYLPQYLLAEDAGFDEPDETIHERCLATLEKMYPGFRRQQVQAIKTARARYVMPLPTLNYSQSLPPVVSSLPGLYLLNSAQVTRGNLNVNETLETLEDAFQKHVWPDATRA